MRYRCNESLIVSGHPPTSRPLLDRETASTDLARNEFERWCCVCPNGRVESTASWLVFLFFFSSSPLRERVFFSSSSWHLADLVVYRSIAEIVSRLHSPNKKSQGNRRVYLRFQTGCARCENEGKLIAHEMKSASLSFLFPNFWDKCFKPIPKWRFQKDYFLNSIFEFTTNDKWTWGGRLNQLWLRREINNLFSISKLVSTTNNVKKIVDENNLYNPNVEVRVSSCLIFPQI